MLIKTLTTRVGEKLSPNSIMANYLKMEPKITKFYKIGTQEILFKMPPSSLPCFGAENLGIENATDFKLHHVEM